MDGMDPSMYTIRGFCKGDFVKDIDTDYATYDILQDILVGAEVRGYTCKA